MAQENPLEIIMSDSISSADPFSDRFAVSSSPTKTNLEDSTEPVTTTDSLSSRIANRPDKVTIPILEALSPVSPWSPLSSGSTLSMASTVPTSPTTGNTLTPIQWTNADLMYLLTILYPADLTTNRLILLPSLNSLPTAPLPLTLRLYRKDPKPPSPDAFSKHAPIGTGRPTQRTLLAASNTSATASTARQFLAQNLLSDIVLLNTTLDRYNVLTTLHHLCTPTLCAIHRTLLLMTRISDKEWIERLNQLCGFVHGQYTGPGVDVSHPVEARLEIYFLGIGRREVEGWKRDVQVALGLEEGERRVWGRVYADAGAFLGRVAGEGGGC